LTLPLPFEDFTSSVCCPLDRLPAIVRKMARRQRRDDWDKFVKALERDITGTPRRGFKIFKQLQLQERDKLKIDPIAKAEWKEYYGKLWNEQGSKGEEEQKRRGEVK